MKGLIVDFGGVLTTNVFDSFKAFCRAEGLPEDSVKNMFREQGEGLSLLRRLEKGELTMVLTKGNAHVYRVVVEQATMPIDNAWLSDMFMHDHRVRLGQLTSDLEEYVDSLNVAQG